MLRTRNIFMKTFTHNISEQKNKLNLRHYCPVLHSPTVSELTCSCLYVIFLQAYENP